MSVVGVALYKETTRSTGHIFAECFFAGKSTFYLGLGRFSETRVLKMSKKLLGSTFLANRQLPPGEKMPQRVFCFVVIVVSLRLQVKIYFGCLGRLYLKICCCGLCRLDVMSRGRIHCETRAGTVKLPLAHCSTRHAARSHRSHPRNKWGFPKIRGTFLRVPIIRIIVFGVYIGVPLFWETTKSVYGGPSPKFP